MTDVPFVLIHSPLVGAFTWMLVADYLRQEGHTVFTPALLHSVPSDHPYWQQEVEGFEVPVGEAVVVGHSGAGALLPAIGQKLQVRGYLFVDAVVLFEPTSRLALLQCEDATFAEEFEQYLREGEQFPNWQDEHLQPLISKDDLRQKLLADMRPRSLDFFTERIDVPPGWDTAPCGYLQLSPTYGYYADQAEAREWQVVRRNTHHFEMLTHPIEIARLLVRMRQTLIA